MNSRRRPPPPTSPIDRLFLRLAREAHAVDIDGHFGRRVRRVLERRRPTDARTIPVWAAVAAAVLVALGVGARGTPARGACVVKPAPMAVPRPQPEPTSRPAADDESEDARDAR